MRGGKQYRQAAALGNRDQRRLIRTGRLEHRTNIVDLLLESRGASGPAGHPGTTTINWMTRANDASRFRNRADGGTSQSSSTFENHLGTSNASSGPSPATW